MVTNYIQNVFMYECIVIINQHEKKTFKVYIAKSLVVPVYLYLYFTN